VAEQSGVSVTPISATPMVRRGYGRDDIVNGRAGRGGVGIVDERFVGGGLDDTMNTVGRLLQGLTAEHFTWQTAAPQRTRRSSLRHPDLEPPVVYQARVLRWVIGDDSAGRTLCRRLKANQPSGPICEGPADIFSKS
jgi:hypothetical protein